MRVNVFGVRWSVPSLSVCLQCQARQQIRQISSSAVKCDGTQASPGSRIIRKKPARRSKTAVLPQEGETVRTRFAPSPTGSLHLGSARTALYNYLLAKKCGGQFLLRIEDTDQKRSSKEFEIQIYKELSWLGLEWDEGPGPNNASKGSLGPYKQSQRLHLYKEHAQKLLDTGKAYRCFCSPEDLQGKAQARSTAGRSGRYDRTCAHIPREQSNERAAAGEDHTIRLLSSEHVTPPLNDLIFGEILNTPGANPDADSFDDPILIKQDGWPTYHLANVVDDHLMEITHVIRGVEWIPSTPMHLELYNAFGWTPPKFAHVPLLVDTVGAKLSKRDGAGSIQQLRDLGVFPESIVNFAALLGWSHKERSDVMSLSKLESLYDLKLTKGNTIVDTGKLRFLQNAHAVENVRQQQESYRALVDEVTQLVQARFGSIVHLIHGSRPLDQYVSRLLKADVKNFTTAGRFVEESRYLFIPVDNIRRGSFPPQPTSEDNVYPSLDSDEVYFKNVGNAPLGTDAKVLYDQFTVRIRKLSPEEWTEAALKEIVDTILREQTEIQMRLIPEPGLAPWKIQKALAAPFWHTLRHAIAFGRPGLSLPVAMELLGPQECQRRFEIASTGTKAHSSTPVDTN